MVKSITDNYRWLEQDDSTVLDWEKAQEALSVNYLDSLPQFTQLQKRFTQLWKHEDKSIPTKVIDGDRIFFFAKGEDDEKWIYYTQKDAQSEPEILINPNEWDPTLTLAGTYPSRDGKLLAYGVDSSGNEDPRIRILDVENKQLLPDVLLGWKQGSISWFPDNTGFYYSARPLKGDVPDGEEHYWQSSYSHILGTPANHDKKVFGHDTVKEYFHGVFITEDGKYVIYYRNKFYKNEIWFRPIDQTELIPITTGFEVDHNIAFIDDTIIITTDREAPNYQVFKTTIVNPTRENWQPLIPETLDRLEYLAPMNKALYAIYSHNAYTLIKIFDMDGNLIRELQLPTLGSADVSGRWNDRDIYLSFSSFAYPPTIFTYDSDLDSLTQYYRPPIDINYGDVIAEQIWYPSLDGTRISMFLIHRKNLGLNGQNPTLLTGYGGFMVSMNPYFSTVNLVMADAGARYSNT